MRTEAQHIPENIDRNNREIVSCFNHFSERYKQRFKDRELTIGSYWNEWVVLMRGFFIKEEDGIMERMIGSYVKEEKIYKIVYKKINKYNIYVPLTIFEIVDHKKKYRMYRRKLKYKNEKIL